MSQLQGPTFLESILAFIYKFGSTPLLKIPSENALGSEWDVVTYSDFGSILHHTAVYWRGLLSESGLKVGDVVLLRITGEDYADLVHIFGLCFAGYTPQLVPVDQPHSWEVVSKFMTLSQAKAMLCDPLYAPAYSSPPIPLHRIPKFDNVPVSNNEDEQLSPPLLPGSVAAVIFHTSGTTGTPKLVPVSYDWMRNNMFRETVPFGDPPSDQNFLVNKIGSWVYFASIKQFLLAMSRGDCVIKPTCIDFSPAELVAMARNAGLNKLMMYPTFLCQHLQAAQNDPEVLTLLRGLKQVVYTGAALQKEYSVWAYEHGIPLISIHASTECGGLLVSSAKRGPDSHLLRPTSTYMWVPFGEDLEADTFPQQYPTKYLELVIPASHPSCPDTSLRGGDANADHHTGDLFEEVKPGLFQFIGRTDDLIKMRNCGFCNTRAIQAYIYSTCSDLVASCVVVGPGRDSPALLVEATDISLAGESKTSTHHLREEIINRITALNQKVSSQERITNPILVRVVPQGTLPRTPKGGISRRATETKFSKEIEDMYAECIIASGSSA